MQNCLGMYIENNLIKYAKILKEPNGFRVESFGIKFFEDLNDAIRSIIEETYSFNTPISINLENERYLYYDVFSLLSKKDIEKTIQTEFEMHCTENRYNPNAFETRFALVPSLEDKDKIKAMQVVVNKIELNKQKQYLERHNLANIIPIGTAIASITKFEKNENVLIVNMEEKTTITTIYNKQIYNVETLDIGCQEVIGKINKSENSIKKAYEICKGTTIYTANVIEDAEEQPYLEHIVPTIYKICQKVQEKIKTSNLKISTVYLTGTLATVNNVDLYFQEFMTKTECKILKPSIIEEKLSQLNIKDYLEVNSAIALAMQALGEGTQALNFRERNIKDKLKQLSNVEFNIGKTQKSKNGKPKKEINFSLKGKLDKTEIMLIRCVIAIILINLIFMIFSKLLYKQMDNKQIEIEGLINEEKTQISNINTDINSLNLKNTKYKALTEELKAINEKISNIAEMKNSIPNLLNQIMFIIPESVQLTSIENESGKKIKIIAQAGDYDQLGYFIAKIKVEGILKDVVSSSGQKNGDIVTVTIEGVLP